jgi:hypothetical protein
MGQYLGKLHSGHHLACVICEIRPDPVLFQSQTFSYVAKPCSLHEEVLAPVLRIA